MNIVLISTGKYPDQHAAAIRHSTIAKGMVELGNSIIFFVITPQSWVDNILNYDGVNFISLNGYKENNKILNKIHYHLALNKLKIELRKLVQKNNIDCVVNFAIDNEIFKVINEVNKNNIFKVFHERTELPNVIGKSNSFFGIKRYNKYLNEYIPKLDGVFVISNKIKVFFKPYNQSCCKVLTVVDNDFFNKSKEVNKYGNYIAYCGTMTGEKDGITILVKAFAKLLSVFPEYKLVLIGNNKNKKALSSLYNLINDLNISESIIFTGFVERSVMPSLLGNSKLLVVSKPDNEQNSGNFPIKVGEYMATGIPVVLTRVGEIPNYIKDGISGYLAEPDSVNSFYVKMKEALSNYDKSLIMARKAKCDSEVYFNYKVQTKVMLDFIIKKNEN